MASLNGQTIASSYEQLLHTDTDGGGNGNTLVSIKDGDNGTTFGLKLATNKVEIIPGSDDANAFEVSQADGTAIFTVDSSTPSSTFTGDVNFDSNTLFVDASANAVGIGTNSPEDLLHIQGATASVSDTQLVLEGRFGGYGAGINFVSRTSSGGTNLSMAKITADGEAAFDTTASNQDAGLRFFTTLNGSSAEKMRITSAGNVGIGTTSPSKPLHISSAENQVARFESTDAYAGIELKDNGSSTLPPLISALSDDILFYGGNASSRPLIMTLDSSTANVGIGTSSPSAGAVGGKVLHVQNSGATASVRVDRSDASTTGTLSITSGNTSNSLFSTGSKNLTISTNSTTAMTIDSSQKVGIHTTSPNVGSYSSERGVLTISSTDNASLNNYAVLELQGHANANDVSVGDISWLDHTNQNAIVRGGRDSSSTTGFLAFFTNGGSGVTERLKIDENGFVIINQNDTGSVGSTLKQLSLGDSNSTLVDFTNVGTMTGAVVSNSHNDQNTGAAIVFTHRSSSSGISYICSRNEGSDASSLHFGTRGSGGVEEEFRIDKNGNLTATDTSIGSLSDERMKEEIADYTGGLDIIKNLKPRTFKWKKNTKAHNAGKTETRRGFVAQEILEADDYYVREQEVQENETGYEYIKDTGKMYTAKLNDKDAMYISAIQSLLKRIEALENA
tara:strand:+ start:571 stop:2598 length:2028 start_codon:yes stop_codon:yes gene_type:complete